MLLNHPDLIEEVLVTRNRDFIKHYALRLLRPVLGNGLLLSEHAMWLRQRRLMQPAFDRQRLQGYGAAMVAGAQRMMANWHDGQTCDLHDEMAALALRIAAKTLLDVEVADEFDQVADALDVIQSDFKQRFASVFPRPAWLPTPAGFRLRRAVKRLDAIIGRIIRQRRVSRQDRGDLLSMLLAARDEDDGRGMTDRQLRDEVMTMFLAGHETTANVMTWTWWLLAKHPEAEETMLEELNRVVGFRTPKPEDAARLPYVRAVVQEAMRLYPPAYIVGREACQSSEVGGRPIPRGATLLMSQWVTHRDPRWFDVPDRFDPQRWIGARAATIPKHAYFPFGGGPRVCIGANFAMMEVALVLATVAPRFRFALQKEGELKPWPSVTLRPASAVRAVLTRRADSGKTAQ